MAITTNGLFLVALFLLYLIPPLSGNYNIEVTSGIPFAIVSHAHLKGQLQHEGGNDQGGEPNTVSHALLRGNYNQLVKSWTLTSLGRLSSNTLTNSMVKKQFFL